MEVHKPAFPLYPAAPADGPHCGGHLSALGLEGGEILLPEQEF